jgi:hypothetical protein
LASTLKRDVDANYKLMDEAGLYWSTIIRIERLLEEDEQLGQLYRVPVLVRGTLVRSRLLQE